MITCTWSMPSLQCGVQHWKTGVLNTKVLKLQHVFVVSCSDPHTYYCIVMGVGMRLTRLLQPNRILNAVTMTVLTVFIFLPAVFWSQCQTQQRIVYLSCGIYCNYIMQYRWSPVINVGGRWLNRLAGILAVPNIDVLWCPHLKSNLSTVAATSVFHLSVHVGYRELTTPYLIYCPLSHMYKHMSTNNIVTQNKETWSCITVHSSNYHVHFVQINAFLLLIIITHIQQNEHNINIIVILIES